MKVTSGIGHGNRLNISLTMTEAKKLREILLDWGVLDKSPVWADLAKLGTELTNEIEKHYDPDPRKWGGDE